MKVTSSSLVDVKLVEPRIFGDDRGFFFESWNARAFAAAGIDATFVQDNHSQSRRDVLRGLHYQIEHAQGKLVRVVAGEVFDVVVDLRCQSPTFGRSVGMMLSAREWWESLQARYEGRHIEFAITGDDTIAVPRNLYDSVAENLLENARRKRIAQPDITIKATLDTLAYKTLTVCDSGEMIPDAIAAKLFLQPVGSENGTGIGLYQAFRQAQSAGFVLTLANNEKGQVCFCLTERR